jgi:hypothetical protein
MPSISRSAQIAQIIQKRRPLAQKIEAVESNLKTLSVALRKLEKQRDQLLDRVDDSSVIGRLREIDFFAIQRSIDNELVTINSLWSRFSRNTLNVGVVGLARQGKSRLLQSLTGLSKSEIPDGSGDHCTGVRSNIHHNPEVGETYAEVWFHTEHSFLGEVIAPYYWQLQLGSHPRTIQEFADTLPTLPEEIAEKSQNATKYEHLCRYHKNLNKYRNVLAESSPRHISRHEIREYVAQYDLDSKVVYFNYLAVREVKIVCSFPNTDIGQIALVDMPGLGDTGIGDEERMIKTLGQDIDLVLFVKMVGSKGATWAKPDVELYDMAKGALTDLPVKEWSFVVLNQSDRQDPVSRENCERLAETISEKHIDVQGVVIADCTDSKETQTEILERVLNYLEQRVEVLDRQYASACQDRLIQLQRNVTGELDKAKKFLEGKSLDAWYRKFLSLFREEFWSPLAIGLKDLTSSLMSEQDTDDKNFNVAVDSAIAACRLETGIPNLEEIKRKCMSANSNRTGYDECLDEVRTHLSKQFLSLDIALKESLDDAKIRVVEILKTDGRLVNLAEGDGSDFLKNLAKKIPDSLTGLQLGFQTLATFDLQYRGLVQHKIRKHLDVLTPNRTKYKLDSIVGILLKNLTSGESEEAENRKCYEKIANNLCKAQAEAANNCEKELKSLLKEPSQAAFAIVEEFTDRVLRAEGVREVASDVWTEEFDKFRVENELRGEWMQAIGAVERLKQPDSLSFLK